MIEKPKIYSKREDATSTENVVEAFDNSLEELFYIENPHLKSSMPEAAQLLKEYLEKSQTKDVWIYYPWKNTLVHTVEEREYFRLRTARNKEVITKEQQEKYRNLHVGVAGLSVGSAIISALNISGGPKRIKIADFDSVEVTNLNRIRANLLDVGMNKAKIAARNVWEVDPFAEIEVWDSGLSKDNLEKFLLDPKLDLFIDEMDSIDLKIRARLLAKEKGMPVLMATDNGDGVILDVERFDLEPEREIFHGLIGDVDVNELEKLSYKQWLELATKIVGPEYLTKGMKDSLLKIGKEIPSVPQLGTTAAIAGSAMSFVVRRIANKESMPSGRYILNLEQAFIPGYNDPEQVEKRVEATKEFLEKFSKK